VILSEKLCAFINHHGGVNFSNRRWPKKRANYINEGGQEKGFIPTQHRKSDPSNNARGESATPECERSKASRFT